MAKKPKMPQKLQIWIDARKRFHLSHAQIQMAREMGMNPKKFGKLANHRQERWKLPLPQFIEQCYLKRFGRFPQRVLSIEQRAAEQRKKKARQHEAKMQRRAEEAKAAEGTTPAEATQEVDSDEIPF